MFSEASVSLLSTGGLHLVGVCIQGVAGCLHLGEEGGCVSRGVMQIPTVVTSSGGHCSGRYASYLNAFLFYNVTEALN